MKSVPLITRLAVFVRCLSVQGSWNYRTLIGTGFAFALLPILRRAYVDDEEAFDGSVGRHSGLFNAHPYLASMAVGAVARLEMEGEDPMVIERFKMALRGPLGALGDRLIWARWLPVTAMFGIIAWILGAPPLAAVLTFLVPYNMGHLAVRIWGFRTGLRAGRDVGARLRVADLGRVAGKLGFLASGLVGVFLGALSANGIPSRPVGLLLPLIIGVAFWVGVRAGASAWRPTVAILVGCTVLLSLYGVLS